MKLSGRLGDGSVNVLYGMGRVDRTLRDQFIGTLNQARFHKMSKRHDLALACVDEVLAADPDFPEALFIKAQILWEGYQDAAADQLDLLGLSRTSRAQISRYRNGGTVPSSRDILDRIGWLLSIRLPLKSELKKRSVEPGSKWTAANGLSDPKTPYSQYDFPLGTTF